MASPGIIAQAAQHTPAGMAWAVRGVWHTDTQSEAIQAGDAVVPGSLLRPEPAASDHSITILLPDGQSILYECFTVKDCARGFRVPELELEPSRAAIQLIARIRGVLLERRSHPSQPGADAHPQGGRDEAAVVIGPGNRVEIAGLAASLSDGKYIYDLNSIHSAYPPQMGVPLQKAGRSIVLQVPGPGLYSVRILDSLNNPRLDYVIAAVRPGEGARIIDEFHEAQSIFKGWRKDFLSWPTHEFQRYYLEALMFHTAPAPEVTTSPRRATSEDARVTAQPVFSPKPGVSNGDTAVSLSCPTHGAVIHYTIDGSQPFDSSPVYRAPIVMKGLPLRLKAFAASPGRKDSPVVMGTFRVRDSD